MLLSKELLLDAIKGAGIPTRVLYPAQLGVLTPYVIVKIDGQGYPSFRFNFDKLSSLTTRDLINFYELLKK